MALRSRAGPDGAEQCLKGVDKEMKFLSLILAPSAQRFIYCRFASHSGPTLPLKKKERRFRCFHF